MKTPKHGRHAKGNTNTTAPIEVGAVPATSKKENGSQATESMKPAGTNSQTTATTSLNDDDLQSADSQATMAMPPLDVESHDDDSQAAATLSLQNTVPLIEPIKPVDVGVSEKARSRLPLKVFGIALSVIVGVVLVVYVAGAIVFMGRFFPRTVIGESDVSLKTPDEVQTILDKSISGYSLLASGQGFSLDLSSDELNLTIDGKAIANEVLHDMHPWMWPRELFNNHDGTYALVASCNNSGLSDIVGAAVEEFNASATPPVDAKVVFDTQSNQFAIVPEEAGTALSVDAVMLQVDDAITNMERTADIGPEQLIQPNVLSNDPLLTKAAASANGMILANINFTLAGSPAITMDAAVISSWVVIGDDLSITLDEAAITAWVDQVVASYSTTDSERSYTRPDGKQITVSGGSYGWKVDGAVLLDLVHSAIETDQTGTLELPCSQQGSSFNLEGKRDWGNRYVDVDLSEQYARMYDDAGTLIWESGIVSGKPSGGGSLTPTGVYYITNMRSPSTLKGTNPDGSKYESVVTYWMPFVDDLIGLHDANWQSSFGGTRWQDGAGSHGCVNLPVSKAANLYSIVHDGDVVVVHW